MKLDKGDIIKINKLGNPGEWSEGITTGGPPFRSGYFPTDYVEVITGNTPVRRYVPTRSAIPRRSTSAGGGDRTASIARMNSGSDPFDKNNFTSDPFASDPFSSYGIPFSGTPYTSDPFASDTSNPYDSFGGKKKKQTKKRKSKKRKTHKKRKIHNKRKN